jgi:hypothetical protein
MLSQLKVTFSSMVPLVTLLKTQSAKLIVILLRISIPLVMDLNSHLTSDALAPVIDHLLIVSLVLTNLSLALQLMVDHVSAVPPLMTSHGLEHRQILQSDQVHPVVLSSHVSNPEMLPVQITLIIQLF